jgi:hypothetical protein
MSSFQSYQLARSERVLGLGWGKTSKRLCRLLVLREAALPSLAFELSTGYPQKRVLTLDMLCLAFALLKFANRLMMM